ncbi:hypothetical protein GGX14DRAFT_676929 [Mycena pura]|uniref:Uncharacterized protein n=1 Tax=Mycena pura TaxID=153505 RepID=A0AAD6UZB4_9AGAR|nr:hypothetical protein GGX14DRAFT_676929 [Mycena pura]
MRRASTPTDGPRPARTPPDAANAVRDCAERYVFFCFLVFPFLFPSLPFPSFFSPPLPSVLPPSFPRLSNVSAAAPVQVPTPSPPASHADTDPAVAEYVLLPPAGLRASRHSAFLARLVKRATTAMAIRNGGQRTADSARATLALACTPANGAPTRAVDRVPTQTARTHRQRARAPTADSAPPACVAPPVCAARARAHGQRQRARTDSARRTARAPRWRWHAHHPHASHHLRAPHEPARTANGAPTRAADRVPMQTARTHIQRARAPAQPCPHGGHRTTCMRRTTRMRRTSPRTRPTALPRAQLTGCPRRQRARAPAHPCPHGGQRTGPHARRTAHPRARRRTCSRTARPRAWRTARGYGVHAHGGQGGRAILIYHQ